MFLEDLRENIEYRLEILGEDCFYYADRLKKPLMLAALVSVVMTIRSGRSGIALVKESLSSFTDFSMGRTSSGFGNYDSGGYGGFSMTSSQELASLMDSYGNSVKAVKAGVFKDYGSKTTFEGEIVTLKSIESAQPVQDALMAMGSGKVLVVDGGGSTRAAVFDAAMANQAVSNGWAGVIINGCIRNSESMGSISLGVKAIGTHPERGKGKSGKNGSKISFGGVSFAQGKYVYADPDGIVVSKIKQDYVSESSSSYGGFGSDSSFGGDSSYGGGSSFGGGTSYGGQGFDTGGSSYSTGGTGYGNSYGGGTSTGGFGGGGGNDYGGGGFGGGGGTDYGGGGGGGFGGGAAYGGGGGGGYAGGGGGGGGSAYGGGGGGGFGGGGAYGGGGSFGGGYRRLRRRLKLQ